MFSVAAPADPKAILAAASFGSGILTINYMVLISNFIRGGAELQKDGILGSRIPFFEHRPPFPDLHPS